MVEKFTSLASFSVEGGRWKSSCRVFRRVLYRVEAEFHGHCNFSTYWEFAGKQLQVSPQRHRMLGNFGWDFILGANLLKVMILPFHYGRLACCKHKRGELDKEPTALLDLSNFCRSLFPCCFYCTFIILFYHRERRGNKESGDFSDLSIYWRYIGLCADIGRELTDKCGLIQIQRPAQAALPVHHHDGHRRLARLFTSLCGFHPIFWSAANTTAWSYWPCWSDFSHFIFADFTQFSNQLLLQLHHHSNGRISQTFPNFFADFSQFSNQPN